MEVWVSKREWERFYLALGKGLCGKIKGAIYLHRAGCAERCTNAGHILIWRDQWPRPVRHVQQYCGPVVQSLASQALTCAPMLSGTGAGCVSALLCGSVGSPCPFVSATGHTRLIPQCHVYVSWAPQATRDFFSRSRVGGFFPLRDQQGFHTRLALFFLTCGRSPELVGLKSDCCF